MLNQHFTNIVISNASRDLPKLGYMGVESCEPTFDDFRVLVSALLGDALAADQRGAGAAAEPLGLCARGFRPGGYGRQSALDR